MVRCIKLGHETEGLDLPPYPGELGKRIYQAGDNAGFATCRRDRE